VIQRICLVFNNGVNSQVSSNSKTQQKYSNPPKSALNQFRKLRFKYSSVCFNLGLLAKEISLTKMITSETKCPTVLVLFGIIVLLPLLNSSSTESPIPVLDVDPDPNCRCPFNIEPLISLCGYEMLERNRRATRQRKVKQTTCEENVVYDCTRGNSPSSLIIQCPTGTRCSIGSEALSNAHKRLIMADPDHRWCLNETGLLDCSINLLDKF